MVRTHSKTPDNNFKLFLRQTDDQLRSRRAATGLHLLDSPAVSATLKRGPQPGFNNCNAFRFRDHSRTDRNNIGVIMFLGQAGAFQIPTQGATDPSNLVGDHRLPVSTASQDDAQIVFLSGNAFGSRADEVRVVDGRITVGAEIPDLVSPSMQGGFEDLFCLKTGVI